MCNFLSVKCKFICKTCMFSIDNNNEINMHVLNKSIRVHSYFFIDIKHLFKQNSRENDEIKRREISGGMRLNKALLTMYRHCFKSPNTRDIRE